MLLCGVNIHDFCFIVFGYGRPRLNVFSCPSDRHGCNEKTKRSPASQTLRPREVYGTLECICCLESYQRCEYTLFKET